MSQPTPAQPITTSQTIGPFPHEGWRWAFDAGRQDLPVQVTGRVFDGDGNPVSDAVLEAWLPGTAAGFALEGLPGLYRTHTQDDGTFRFSLPSHGVAGEPDFYLVVFARGLVKHQFSAVYLKDNPDAPLLKQVPAERRATLIAKPGPDGTFQWDLHLQGPAETVFFDFT
ncbi:MAG: protocatechuate 3,4-dioxygenase [Rhizobacter sp.]